MFNHILFISIFFTHHHIKIAEAIDMISKNGDSILNVLDIVLLVSFVLDSSNPTNSEFNAGDINDDNILNILDIVSLVNSILNS